jgi:hypothetical protein
MESLIARQQVGDYPLGRMVDLMFGGRNTLNYVQVDSVSFEKSRTIKVVEQMILM